MSIDFLRNITSKDSKLQIGYIFRRRSQHGAFLLELVFIVPIILAMILGGFELARYIKIYSAVSTLSFEFANSVLRDCVNTFGNNTDEVFLNLQRAKNQQCIADFAAEYRRLIEEGGFLPQQADPNNSNNKLPITAQGYMAFRIDNGIDDGDVVWFSDADAYNFQPCTPHSQVIVNNFQVGSGFCVATGIRVRYQPLLFGLLGIDWLEGDKDGDGNRTGWITVEVEKTFS